MFLRKNENLFIIFDNFILLTYTTKQKYEKRAGN